MSGDTSKTSQSIPAENSAIAERLRAYGELVAAHDEEPYRAIAYREAARHVDSMTRPIAEIFAEGGMDALVALPRIGTGIAGAIAEMLTTGRWSQLDRTLGETQAADVLCTIPGIGPSLARELVDIHDVETLEEFEALLHDDSSHIRGIGPRRRAALIASLAHRLAPLRQGRYGAESGPQPEVEILLDADALYRRKAEAGELRRIAPKRFNPKGEAWLPILHARRGDWHLTLLFSNTAQAHRLGRTRDWVVVYARQDGTAERRYTIVTETRGPLSGERVVRGREEDCERHYAGMPREATGGDAL